MSLHWLTAPRVATRWLAANLERVVLSGVAAASLHAHAESSNPVRIALRADVEVAHRRVTLGDIADVTEADAAQRATLLALPLGDVPQTGAAVRIARASLSPWIDTRVGLRDSQIEWVGSAASQVHLATTQVSGETLAQRAKEILRMDLDRQGVRSEIESSRVPRDVDVPAGKLELRPRQVAASSTEGLAGERFIAKHQAVWIDVYVDGQFIRTVPVDLEVSVFAPAYVAVRDLSVGQVLDPLQPDPASVKVRETEWSGRVSAPLKVSPRADRPLPVAPASADDDTLLRVRRPVAAGQALSRADIEPLPKVARGDYALLREREGSIELQSRVEVMEDGEIGQMVRVKPTNASSTILARVTGPHAVEVRQ